MSVNKDNFTESPAKFLSIFVERMVPDYIREDHPKFIAFLRGYFEYLERETGPDGALGEYKQIADLVQHIDVDHALDLFIPEFEKQYLPSIPHTAIDPTVTTSDKGFLAKNIREEYRKKGTESGVDFLFRRDFNTEASIIYPKQWMFKASTSNWFEPKWITVAGSNLLDTNHEPIYVPTPETVVPVTIDINEELKTSGPMYGTPEFDTADPAVLAADATLITVYINGEVAPYYEFTADPSQDPEGPYGGFIWSIHENHLSIHNASNAGKTYKIFWFNEIENDVVVSTFFINEEEFLALDDIYQQGGYFISPGGGSFEGSTGNYINFQYSDTIGAEDFFTVKADATAVKAEQDIYKIYDKRIVGQVSGATAFVDYSDEQRLAEYEKLALAEIIGDFIQGEEVWEDVGTQDRVPVKLTVSSDGIISPGKCFINGEHDEAILSRGACQNIKESDPDNYGNVKTNVWLTDGYWTDSSSFLSSDRKLEDNDYYQDFSYVIRSEVPVQSYREVLKKLVHPVGLKLFAEYSTTSSVIMGATLPEKFSEYLIRIFSYLDVAIDIWKPGQDYGTYHGKNYIWDRPEKYTLTDTLTLPAGSYSWDFTQAVVDGEWVTTAGHFREENEYIYAMSCATHEDETVRVEGYGSEILCHEIDSETGETYGVWGPTIIATTLGEDINGHKFTRNWGYGDATDEWFHLEDAHKLYGLYTRKGQYDVATDKALAEDYRLHQGFELFLEKGYDDYVIEIMKTLEVRSELIPAPDWTIPSEHFSVNILNPHPQRIGNFIKEKLYTISWINDEIRNFMDAFPEKLVLEFTNHLRILDYDSLPPAASALEIFDTIDSATDGGMISCEIWELAVQKGLESVLEWVMSFVGSAQYAKETTYHYWDVNRESIRVQNTYGLGCDVLDSVEIGAFLTDGGVRTHSHGKEGGYAPLVYTELTKGLELPQMDINVSAFHTHEFDDVPVMNLIRNGVEVTTRGLSWEEGRALLARDYFEIPYFYGANLLCGGIMTPMLWGDWVESETDPRYNGIGECFDMSYADQASCEAAMGVGFWMSPMCSDMTSPDDISCHAVQQSWGYFTLESLPAMKGHASFFVQDLVVDVHRGRHADPLSRTQARYLIDNPTEHVVLYDNIAKLDEDGNIPASEIIDGVTQGGTITNIEGEITSAHYHEYHVRYDPIWNTYEDENVLEHGFIFEPITTWLCFNYVPGLAPDENSMGGMDFTGQPWPLNVFNEVPDSYVQNFLNNDSVTLQHHQVWEETHNPNVDWVELFSSNFVQDVPGSGDTGDLIGVEVIGTGTDIATIEAYPIPFYLTSSERDMWFHVNHTVMDHMNGIATAHIDLWAYLQEIMPDGFARIDFNKDGVINQLDLDAYTDEIYKERIIDDAYAVPALVTNFFLDATPQYPIAIVDMSGYIHLQNTTDGSIKDLLLDLSSLQHVIGLGSFANYDERGTLGLAFHPDYVNNGKFYVYYMTELDPSEIGSFATGGYGFPKSRTHISEFTADLSGARPIADISSERELLRVDQPDFNHNGGEVAFGPDGYLYIGLGDGGAADDNSWQGTHGEYGNAQNPTNLLGSILRIDVTPDPIAGTEYTIPADNPFINSLYKAGTPDEAPWRAEAFAYGFRNPWRFSWAPNGDFWVADVGQNKFEEINIVEKGGNYGWRIIEGYHAFEENQSLIDQAGLDLGYANTVEYMNDLKAPIHEYTHGVGISILGGFVYRGAISELQGKYIFGDWSTNWGGTSGHLYTLEEDSSGLSATFNVLANPVDGATHNHTCSLTAAQVELMKANPGTVVNVPQTDTVHAEFYTHIFSLIWSSAGAGSFVLIGQTNPEGHDTLEFIEYSSAVGYIRKPLSIWDPVAETVDLTTLGMSILTMGEDVDGEIYISTRVGINTFQPPSGAGPQNCTIAKITASYDSSVLGEIAIDQIPASQTAHVHGYEITFDPSANEFYALEISDIEMENWDAFYPVWTENEPQSHVHPVSVQWSHAIDYQIPIGSSAGWDGTAPYDIGADTAWAPPVQEEGGYVVIATAPTIVILPSNEFAKESHQHYFSGVNLDTFGVNYGRTSNSISRYDAETLANSEQGTIFKVYGSIHEYPEGNKHYHEIDITYNSATKQFYGIEVSEWVEPVQGTGEYFVLTEQTHEHGITVDGIVTAVGWSGNPIFDAPIVTTWAAHDWNNLHGSDPNHVHLFTGAGLDSVGPNVDRKADPLSDEQTTNLKDGSVLEVEIYSEVIGDHYHSYTITYDGPTNQINAAEVGLWLTEGSGQYFLTAPATHQHAVSVDGLITGMGYSETIDEGDLPTLGSPGYPYPGGSHPHFHVNTVVGPFPDGHIDYAHGLSVDEAQQLIDGIVTSVVIYDSIEGAHFHEYTIKWNDPSNIFYVSSSTTWIRGGIEDQNQDSNKYYPATIMNESEGLHWHNLTIEWNPNDTQYPQQTGGSIYITRITSVDEVSYADPVTTQTSTSTELNPVTTTYPDTPGAGDTTVITTYSDQVVTTTTITTQVTTTTTITTYESDGTDYDTTLTPIVTTEETETTSTEIIEDLTERKTWVNDVLQANNPPIIYIEPTFIDGEGTHDHIQFEGCTLDTEGVYAGRMCEPTTLETANFLINAQDVNIASVFYDSPNGALSHYHSYKLKFNPNQGPEGAFIVNTFSQFDIVSNTGTTIHKFTLSGGFHSHDYWCSEAEYLSLVTGSNIVMVQRDSIHAEQYQHTLTISYSSGQYNIVNQTSDFDGHNLFSYNGVQVTGGEWDEVDVLPGDHIHGTIIDESNVWPVPPS